MALRERVAVAWAASCVAFLSQGATTVHAESFFDRADFAVRRRSLGEEPAEQPDVSGPAPAESLIADGSTRGASPPPKKKAATKDSGAVELPKKLCLGRQPPCKIWNTFNADASCTRRVVPCGTHADAQNAAAVSTYLGGEAPQVVELGGADGSKDQDCGAEGISSVAEDAEE